MSFLLEGAPSLDAPLEGWLSLAYVAFLSTLGGFGAWGWLLRRYNASTVGPYALLVPVFGLSSAALVTGEPLSWPTVRRRSASRACSTPAAGPAASGGAPSVLESTLARPA